jgi:uncharacterized protein GlcG (DUF336 family)
MKTFIKTLIIFILMIYYPILHANDSITVKTIGLELATDIASETITACRKKGYQISAVVVDRSGITQVAMRDTLASRFTLQIAEEKANSVILSGTSSGVFRTSRDDIRADLNHMNGIIIMQGALPIEVAGSRIGAVGVSGAPGGDLDEQCAAEALDKLSERLEFADE